MKVLKATSTIQFKVADTTIKIEKGAENKSKRGEPSTFLKRSKYCYQYYSQNIDLFIQYKYIKDKTTFFGISFVLEK